MGFRPLNAEELAAHENSLRKLSAAPAAPAPKPAKAAVAEPVAAPALETAPAVEAEAVAEAVEAEAAPAVAKNPFKKKG
jgi:hypothetical protein